MSCYKELLTENQDLRAQITELSLGVRGVQEQVAEAEWMSTDELEFVLSTIPITLPWE